MHLNKIIREIKKRQKRKKEKKEKRKTVTKKDMLTNITVELKLKSVDAIFM
jgi:hypothetical protein